MGNISNYLTPSRMINFDIERETTPLVLEGQQKQARRRFVIQVTIGVIAALAVLCLLFYVTSGKRSNTLAQIDLADPSADDSAEGDDSTDSTKDDAATTKKAVSDAGAAVGVAADSTAKTDAKTVATALKDCAWYESAWDTVKEWFGSDKECK